MKIKTWVYLPLILSITFTVITIYDLWIFGWDLLPYILLLFFLRYSSTRKPRFTLMCSGIFTLSTIIFLMYKLYLNPAVFKELAYVILPYVQFSLIIIYVVIYFSHIAYVRISNAHQYIEWYFLIYAFNKFIFKVVWCNKNISL